MFDVIPAGPMRDVQVHIAKVLGPIFPKLMKQGSGDGGSVSEADFADALSGISHLEPKLIADIQAVVFKNTSMLSSRYDGEEKGKSSLNENDFNGLPMDMWQVTITGLWHNLSPLFNSAILEKMKSQMAAKVKTLKS